MKTIDVTPTWTAILPLLIAAIQDGTPSGQNAATRELMRLAQMMDARIAQSEKNA
ncbi:hypothetical protein UFOVP408_44 [uncultured Caudovirales phage]|uniref:Uncharacterized protein n=1 Tax=uncultured Caudovirales phage TaxID=2100421 RepID=A0A6J5M1E5_9CAUD|nr:hypothetical protein UFOVP356_49 [uncultured Caudovirales phage]CAB4140614.1 hypothetical protein UFOVP408_44 [uncultured Caudovirales phage]CAB4156915.1 hypothetical protein UFOVP676_29 [uncultured Caudovirales phage]